MKEGRWVQHGLKIKHSTWIEHTVWSLTKSVIETDSLLSSNHSHSNSLDHGGNYTIVFVK